MWFDAGIDVDCERSGVGVIEESEQVALAGKWANSEAGRWAVVLDEWSQDSVVVGEELFELGVGHAWGLTIEKEPVDWEKAKAVNWPCEAPGCLLFHFTRLSLSSAKQARPRIISLAGNAPKEGLIDLVSVPYACRTLRQFAGKTRTAAAARWSRGRNATMTLRNRLPDS